MTGTTPVGSVAFGAPGLPEFRSTRRIYLDIFRRRIIVKFALTVILWAIVAFISLPLLWAVLTSLKPDPETMHYPPTLLPAAATLNNYILLFQVLPFARYFLNTVLIAGATSVATIVLSTLAAYAMARFRNRVADFGGLVGLVAYMLPGILVVVPVFTVAHALNALDSPVALTVLYIAYFVPFGVWQLRSYFAGLPRDLEDASMVDGASRFEAFYMVVLPQALPGIIATGIFTFAVAWNEYLFASLLLYTPSNQTLSAGLATVLVGQLNLYSWGILMAGSTLMTLPVLIVFMFVQRQLVAGFSSGAVKG
ncbi:MAG: carbohydrate ABC transporter permease [Chloroflexi bacterium]|nr:carbohydrate ABC transporter permease [Chloroflexota bacterium]